MDEDFQVLLTNNDYHKLQNYEAENKKLVEANAKLCKQLDNQKLKIKDLQKAVYIRDTFIDYIASESDYAFGEILGLSIIPTNLNQSVYQDVVTFEQNGISGIEMREAMELYTESKKQLFDRFNAVQDRFLELNNQIALLEAKKPVQKQNDSPPMTELQFCTKMAEKATLQVTALRTQITKMEETRDKLAKETEILKNRNIKLLKEGEQLSKKLQTQGQKSYVIKLMVDEYYGELEKNLKKIVGLTQSEVKTVIGNEMKGIKIYIDNLIDKTTI